MLHLPLAFDCSTTKQAIDTYQRTVKSEAPWLPSNVEFIRRINGLDSVQDVAETVFRARYMVLGLGDVYLGGACAPGLFWGLTLGPAPCAVPLDPTTRLMTTKYNPARTWTAEGEVGIGGVYMCIYGMESPGGYQLVGRTVPVWSTHVQAASFHQPWLLEFFDQVRAAAAGRWPQLTVVVVASRRAEEGRSNSTPPPRRSCTTSAWFSSGRGRTRPEHRRSWRWSRCCCTSESHTPRWSGRPLALW